MSVVARTPAEILARIEALGPLDTFGWARGVLIEYLPYGAVKPYLNEGVNAAQWEAVRSTDPKADLLDYLDFAWEKALGERGLSANRSVAKVAEWLWLLGDDALLGRFLAAPYPQYGIPQLAVVTRELAPEKLPAGVGA